MACEEVVGSLRGLYLLCEEAINVDCEHAIAAVFLVSTRMLNNLGWVAVLSERSPAIMKGN